MKQENPRQLGQQLVQKGIISAEQLALALQEQRQHYRLLGKLLQELGFIKEKDLRLALAKHAARQEIDLSHINISEQALHCVPQEIARRHRMLPTAFDITGQRLTIAVSDPSDIIGLDRLRAFVGENIEIDAQIAGEAEIEQAIDRHYGQKQTTDSILREIEQGLPPPPPDGLIDDHETSPVIRLVNSIIEEAIRSKASDIHFEPEASYLRIRIRIDGLLRQTRILHHSHWPAMAVRLKVMAGMDIAESRSAQDGHFSLRAAGRNIDFRTASHPTLHGENIVLRLLDRERGITPLAALGLPGTRQQQLERMLARPEGLMLVTGPTGSGKTTTLYSILTHLDEEGVNIMTLEDPVEYPMPRIRQTTINEQAKLDFPNGVRALLRQDPDIILIGEIRDRETAEMALRAALTGHQVFSTLHANSSIGTLARLIDLGIRRELIAGNLIGIIAQRLVRRLCPDCSQPVPLKENERLLFARAGQSIPLEIRTPTGCPACQHHGYRGRLAVMEILPIDNALDELVASGATSAQLAAHARQHGFTSLAEAALEQVSNCQTSLAEISRVVDLTPWQ